MTIESRMITLGMPGETQRATSSDVSQRIGAVVTLSLSSDTTKRCTGILITVETEDIRLAFNVNAVQTAGSEIGHPIAVGGSYFISGGHEASNAYFINSTNGSNAMIQFTPYFE